MAEHMTKHNDLLRGKRGLIMGVANDRSIAWGIAAKAHEAGAELAFTFQGEALEKRVRPLAASINSDFVLSCDVTNDDDIDRLFSEIEQKWGKLDFIVHAIAYSDKAELKGDYFNTTRDNFSRTMDISVYSLTAIAQRAQSVLNDGGAILDLNLLWCRTGDATL